MKYNKRHKKITLKLEKKVIKIVSLVALFLLLGDSSPILAVNENVSKSIDFNERNFGVCTNLVVDDSPYVEVEVIKSPSSKPAVKLIRIKNTYKVAMTAYNSEAGQTDDSPCITANGFDLCAHGIEDTVAANFLPMGAKVRIPAYFGDKVFVVRDRMHPRYSDRIDVWMAKKTDAIKFGLKSGNIVIID